MDFKSHAGKAGLKMKYLKGIKRAYDASMSAQNFCLKASPLLTKLITKLFHLHKYIFETLEKKTWAFIFSFNYFLEKKHHCVMYASMNTRSTRCIMSAFDTSLKTTSNTSFWWNFHFITTNEMLGGWNARHTRKIMSSSNHFKAMKEETRIWRKAIKLSL